MKKIRLTPRAYDALFNDKEPAALRGATPHPRTTTPKLNGMGNPFMNLLTPKP